MTRVCLELRSLGKTFQNGATGAVVALEDVDLDVCAGEFILIVGANGSGKTTLLHLITGVLAPTTGNIRQCGPEGAVDWGRLSRRDRSVHVAQVYQDPREGTVTDMTLEDNLRLVAMQRGLPSLFRWVTSRDDRYRFEKALSRAGVAGRLGTYMRDLSQGQRQILALEMALMRRPWLLALDEPTASLDRQNATRCMQAIARIGRDDGVATLVVTHNLGDALRFGDRLVVLRGGRVVANLAEKEKQALAPADIFALCGLMELG